MYSDNTARIVVLPGGGTRGYSPICYLELFANLWGVPFEQWYPFVDVVAGTSVGSFSTAALAKGGITTTTIKNFFLQKAPKIFTIRSVTEIGQCDTSTTSNRPNTAQKIGLILTNNPFYESACSPSSGNSNYGSNILHSSLVEMFGEMKLNELQTQVLIPAVKESSNEFVYFSSFNGFPYQQNDAKIVDVLRASSAAPIYLPSYTFNNAIYTDGGLFNNAPIMSALKLAKRVKPQAKKFCVLVLDTGKTPYGFEGETTGDVETSISRLVKLYEVAMDGNTSNELLNLQLETQYNIDLNNQVYSHVYRPVYDSILEIDNSTTDFFNLQSTKATTAFNNNMTEVANFLTHWTQ
jgi:predicted acylesterase/phospholipase RssA